MSVAGAGLFGVPELPQKLAAQQVQGFPWMSAEMAHVGSHIGDLEPIHQGENAAIEGSQGLGSTRNTNLACIFPHGDITTPVQAIFDAPMGLLESQQARGVRFPPGQIGDPIDGLLALVVSVLDVSV